jgi:hypothetical protein
VELSGLIHDWVSGWASITFFGSSNQLTILCINAFEKVVCVVVVVCIQMSL